MKKRWLLIVVILLALIVAVLIIFALFSHQAPAPSPLSTNPFADAIETGAANMVTDPATFSMDFFKWYIGNEIADTSFPSTQQLATSFTQWMTPAFILQYQTALDDPDTEVDPILDAQDDPRGWGSGMTASVVTQTNTASSVKVTIGSGDTIHTYMVQLVKTNGQWLIDSITAVY